MKKLALLMVLTAGIYAQDIYATFKVKAQKEANLAFSAGGIVNRVNADIGAVVKKGDVLASLQNSDLKALYEIALIAQKYAKKDYNRQLRVKDVINRAHLDAFAFKYDSAKAKAKYQKSLLDKTYLKVPFDGVVIYKAVEAGDVVSGMAPRTIFKIQSEHDRKLLVNFDQKYSSVVKVGDTFKYKIDGSEKEYIGKISKIYPTIDTKSRQAIAEVKAKDFKPGLFGTGTIVTEGK